MPEERIELIDTNITQSEAGKYMAGLELDLIAYYKTLEAEVLKIAGKNEDPENIIDKIDALFIEPEKEEIEKSEDNMSNKIEKGCVPKPSEKKSDFISRCIRDARHKGKEQDEAKGMCYGIWNEHATKAKKTIPKNDGSGKGKRDNKGRSGCEDTELKGKGKNIKKANLFNQLNKELKKLVNKL